jgi:hypothetical protein
MEQQNWSSDEQGFRPQYIGSDPGETPDIFDMLFKVKDHIVYMYYGSDISEDGKFIVFRSHFDKSDVDKIGEHFKIDSEYGSVLETLAMGHAKAEISYQYDTIEQAKKSAHALYEIERRQSE